MNLSLTCFTAKSRDSWPILWHWTCTRTFKWRAATTSWCITTHNKQVRRSFHLALKREGSKGLQEKGIYFQHHYTIQPCVTFTILNNSLTEFYDEWEVVIEFWYWSFCYELSSLFYRWSSTEVLKALDHTKMQTYFLKIYWTITPTYNIYLTNPLTSISWSWIQTKF